jgi:hypothetical protein
MVEISQPYQEMFADKAVVRLGHDDARRWERE